MSGIPGGGGTGELVLCSIFFPDHLAVAFPIALALGNLVDPPATMVNSAGDYVVSFIVARFVDGKDWLRSSFRNKSRTIKEAPVRSTGRGALCVVGAEDPARPCKAYP